MRYEVAVAAPGVCVCVIVCVVKEGSGVQRTAFHPQSQTTVAQIQTLKLHFAFCYYYFF